jgi:hypothetical protein
MEAGKPTPAEAARLTSIYSGVRTDLSPLVYPTIAQQLAALAAKGLATPAQVAAVQAAAPAAAGAFIPSAAPAAAASGVSSGYGATLPGGGGTGKTGEEAYAPAYGFTGQPPPVQQVPVEVPAAEKKQDYTAVLIGVVAILGLAMLKKP